MSSGQLVHPGRKSLALASISALYRSNRVARFRHMPLCVPAGRGTTTSRVATPGYRVSPVIWHRHRARREA